MQANVGRNERMIRVAVGVVLAIAGLTVTATAAQAVLFIAAAVAFVTAAAGFCPLWKVLGINTCRVK